jgi:glucans biosynthesis protein C
MVNKKEKDKSVESLRGAAIILVVIGHVIGSGSDGGMQVSDNSFLRHFYYTFEYLRMPLFTVISGWVYALHPVDINHVGGFLVKKVRRILLPMIFVGATYFIVQYFMPGTNSKGNLSEIWKILVFPYTLFWYLPSLFLVFAVVTLIDSFLRKENFFLWIAVFSMALAMLLLRNYVIPQESPNYFSYKGAIYLLPFFVMGVGISRFKPFFSNRYFLYGLFVLLVASLVIQQLVWYKVIDYDLSKSGGIGLLIGLTGTILLFQLKWSVKWLIWLGSFAYSIFLFHAFGTAGGRIIIQKLGIDSTALVFAVSLLVGMIIPIIAEKILDTTGPTRMLFLGRAFNKKNKGD